MLRLGQNFFETHQQKINCVETVDELGVVLVLGGGVEQEVLGRQSLHERLDDAEEGQNLAHVVRTGHLDHDGARADEAGEPEHVWKRVDRVMPAEAIS